MTFVAPPAWGESPRSNCVKHELWIVIEIDNTVTPVSAAPCVVCVMLTVVLVASITVCLCLFVCFALASLSLCHCTYVMLMFAICIEIMLSNWPTVQPEQGLVAHARGCAPTQSLWAAYGYLGVVITACWRCCRRGLNHFMRLIFIANNCVIHPDSAVKIHFLIASTCWCVIGFVFVPLVS